MSPILLILIIFCGFFVLSLTGFGHALVIMPLLAPLIGVQTAAPLVSMAALTGEIIMLLRYRRQLNLCAVWRLTVASCIAIPLGVFGARAVDQRLVLILLGLLAAGYGLYALLTPGLPELRNPNWAFGFGFLAGLFSGAYNTGGPPIVVYGNLSRWPPAEFKSSLQGMFVLNSVLIVTTHTLAGNITGAVLGDYLLAIPGLALGLLAGFRLEKWVNPVLFRRLVLLLLVVIGLRLIVTNLIGA